VRSVTVVPGVEAARVPLDIFEAERYAVTDSLAATGGR